MSEINSHPITVTIEDGEGEGSERARRNDIEHNLRHEIIQRLNNNQEY